MRVWPGGEGWRGDLEGSLHDVLHHGGNALLANGCGHQPHCLRGSTPPLHTGCICCLQSNTCVCQSRPIRVTGSYAVWHSVQRYMLSATPAAILPFVLHFLGAGSLCNFAHNCCTHYRNSNTVVCTALKQSTAYWTCASRTVHVHRIRLHNTLFESVRCCAVPQVLKHC